MVFFLPRCSTMLSPKIGLTNGSGLSAGSGGFWAKALHASESRNPTAMTRMRDFLGIMDFKNSVQPSNSLHKFVGFAQQSNSCASLMHFKAASVEISKPAPIAAGTAEPNPWGAGHGAPIPANYRVHPSSSLNENRHILERPGAAIFVSSLSMRSTCSIPAGTIYKIIDKRLG